MYITYIFGNKCIRKIVYYVSKNNNEKAINYTIMLYNILNSLKNKENLIKRIITEYREIHQDRSTTDAELIKIIKEPEVISFQIKSPKSQKFKKNKRYLNYIINSELILFL